MEQQVIRVGILGAGFIGEKHREAYAQIPRARVVAVADRREDYASKLAKKAYAQAYTSLEAMLQCEKLDVLDVCLPTTMHKDAVLTGLRNGLDVLVEKPFALDLGEAETMSRAAREYRRRLMVAHVCRFMPEYVYGKGVIETGELGRPLFFGAWRESATPSWSWNNWLHDPNLSGGTVMDLQIHDIDLANWFLGTPKTFYAQQVHHPEIKGPSHVISNMVYENGAMASLEAGHLMPANYPFSTGYRLVLERGVVECFSRENEKMLLRIVNDAGVREISDAELTNPLNGDPYAEELHHFIESILREAPFRIETTEAKLALYAVTRLMESLNTGTKIS